MTIAQAVREYLDSAGIKQSFLAEKCGWTKQRMSSIVRGTAKMSAEDYACICDALGVPYGMFYDLARQNSQTHTAS